MVYTWFLFFSLFQRDPLVPNRLSLIFSHFNPLSQGLMSVSFFHQAIMMMFPLAHDISAKLEGLPRTINKDGLQGEPAIVLVLRERQK